MGRLGALRRARLTQRHGGLPCHVQGFCSPGDCRVETWKPAQDPHAPALLLQLLHMASPLPASCHPDHVSHGYVSIRVSRASLGSDSGGTATLTRMHEYMHLGAPAAVSKLMTLPLPQQSDSLLHSLQHSHNISRATQTLGHLLGRQSRSEMVACRTSRVSPVPSVLPSLLHSRGYACIMWKWALAPQCACVMGFLRAGSLGGTR